MTWPDGGYYEGDFYQGQMHGRGKLVRADGTIGFHGKYRDGQPMLSTSTIGDSSSSSSMASTSSYRTAQSAAEISTGAIKAATDNNYYASTSRRRPASQTSSRPIGRGGSQINYHPGKKSSSTSRSYLPQTISSQDQDCWDQISHCTGAEDDGDKFERGSLADI